MGKFTHNFRQSKRSLSGSNGARNFAPIQRMNSWYGKITNLIKVRGKSQTGV